jgi:hypothetical protein
MLSGVHGLVSAGQLPPATKHWVNSFHSTTHCTPGYQNLYAPTNEFAWPACQVSDLDVGCVALAKPWFSTFQIFVPGCAQQHHSLPLPTPWHHRAAWFVSLGHCASFGGGGWAERACAHWCELWWEDIKPRVFAPWLELRQKKGTEKEENGGTKINETCRKKGGWQIRSLVFHCLWISILLNPFSLIKCKCQQPRIIFSN